MDKFLNPNSTQLGEVHDAIETTPNTTHELTPTPNNTNPTPVDLKSPKKEANKFPPPSLPV